MNSHYKAWRYKKIEDQENKYLEKLIKNSAISDSAISIVF